MIILGIDPGLAKTGWGVVKAQNQKFSLIAYGVIKTETDYTLEHRIFTITEEFVSLTERYGPTDVSIEDIYFFKNISSAFPIAKVIGAIGYAAMARGIAFRTFTPLQIKTALTGNGRAEKNQIQEMVRLILGQTEIPRPDHAADALAAGICYHNHAVYNQRMG
jgi:crossover junction endodeoxyribonuclease RuvC